MEDIYINNIGIIFIKSKKNFNLINLNSKNAFNKKKINILEKQKQELINENVLIKYEFYFCIKKWNINHSASDKLIHSFLNEKLKIENILIKNKKRINYLDKLIQNLLNNRA